MSKITVKEVWRTIHADLIGKDSHRGITLTYGWMANQVGHFALGFIPSSILFLSGFSGWLSTWTVGLFWLVFECVNMLSPLYKPEYKGNGTFRPAWGNLIFDTFTDLCFFWVGSLTLFFIVAGIVQPWFFIFLGGIVLLFFAGRYWFLTKLYQQNAYFPFPFRISQWNKALDSQTQKWIGDIIHSQTAHHVEHWLIFGKQDSGKTALSVGVANELAIKHRKVLYTTYGKWVNSATQPSEEIIQRGKGLWTWLDTEFLVIDDINPGYPQEANLVKSSELWQVVKKYESSRNSRFLSGHAVFWVVGSCHQEEKQEDWVGFLLNLGLNHDQIKVINLG
jgi:hypothetical protein